MSFYFRESRATSEARLHVSTCGHCERGVASQARAAFGNTESWWHGPYETRERAEREAERLVLTLRLCRWCIPTV
jgi:hypothetical protein